MSSTSLINRLPRCHPECSSGSLEKKARKSGPLRIAARTLTAWESVYQFTDMPTLNMPFVPEKPALNDLSRADYVSPELVRGNPG